MGTWRMLKESEDEGFPLLKPPGLDINQALPPRSPSQVQTLLFGAGLQKKIKNSFWFACRLNQVFAKEHNRDVSLRVHFFRGTPCGPTFRRDDRSGSSESHPRKNSQRGISSRITSSRSTSSPRPYFFSFPPSSPTLLPIIPLHSGTLSHCPHFLSSSSFFLPLFPFFSPLRLLIRQPPLLDRPLDLFHSRFLPLTPRLTSLPSSSLVLPSCHSCFFPLCWTLLLSAGLLMASYSLWPRGQKTETAAKRKKEKKRWGRGEGFGVTASQPFRQVTIGACVCVCTWDLCPGWSYGYADRGKKVQGGSREEEEEVKRKKKSFSPVGWGVLCVCVRVRASVSVSTEHRTPATSSPTGLSE